MTECEFQNICDQVFGCGRDCSREPKSIEINVQRCSLRAFAILVHNHALNEARSAVKVCKENNLDLDDYLRSLKMEEK